ncbi:hypothetical protein IX51_08615 [uncultured archaeon]|nr:hypothetical protein IX51_08615 [uncultured archaeon]
MNISLFNLILIALVWKKWSSRVLSSSSEASDYICPFVGNITDNFSGLFCYAFLFLLIFPFFHAFSPLTHL